MTESLKSAPMVSLRVSPDGMAMHAILSQPGASAHDITGAIRTVADRRSIDLPDSDEELKDKVFAALRASKWPLEILLLEGESPSPPVNEEIEWTRDFFRTGFVVDPKTGRMNYRERAANRNVGAGENLACIIPGIPGKPGKDVLGERIAVSKPQKCKIRAGRRVSLDKESGIFTADADGRIAVIDDRICVSERYEIKGNVGLETGNIDFQGRLFVQGDIEDTTIVSARGDIEVGGSVGACRIDCGDDVVVRGGIVGKGKGEIIAQGVVKAAWITNTDVKADKGMVVGKEIVQCQVGTHGPVVVENGRIVGGEVIALGGITVREAGSDGDVRTLLVAGEDYLLPPFLEECKKEISELRDQIKRMAKTLGPLKTKIARMTPEQREMLHTLTRRVPGMEERIEEIEAEMGERIKHQNQTGIREVKILNTVFANVTIRISGQSTLVKEEQTGPLTFVLNNSRRVVMKRD